MKLFCLFIFIFLLKNSLGQQCNCDSNPNLREVISCKKINFKNYSKLYWQFNCDSSWLTFENKYGKKKILYALESPYIEFSERLGYRYSAEYKSTFLIQNKLISGCCDPPEFILFDKNTGKLKLNLGSIIYYSEDSKYPFVIYLSKANYNSLTILNVDKNKNNKIELPIGRIHKTLKITDELFPEHLFEEGKNQNGVLKISYRYKKNTEDKKWYKDEIVIDLKNM